MELVLSFFCHRFPFLSDTFLEYIPLLDKMYPTVTFDKTWESALSRVACHQSHLFRLYEEKMTPAKYPLATWSSSLIPRQIISEIRYKIQRTTTPKDLKFYRQLGYLKQESEVMKASNYSQLKADFPHFTTKEKYSMGTLGIL